MVDLTRDVDGRLHARLPDVVPSRSGTAYAGWLGQQRAEFINAVEHAALDPFRGYANAIRDELPDAVAVLDAFHVVRWAPKCSTKSGAASNRTLSATVGTATIRSTRSAGCCVTVPRTSPTDNSRSSTPASRPATRTTR
jgi:hypothetical protein